MNISRIVDAICVIFAVILGLMVIASILSNVREGYEITTGIVCMIFCLLPLLLKYKNLILIPLPLVVLAEITIFFHAYGVLLMHYDLIVLWDTFTHTAASITVALCVFYALLCINNFNKKMMITPATMHIYVFLITMTLSVYWEVFELIADVVTGTSMQYSPWDTIRDLICDIAGAVIIMIYSHHYMKNRDVESFVKKLNLHPRIKKLINPDFDEAGEP